MKKYILDTNICAYFFNGQFNLKDKINRVGFANCFVSEITIAELKYGIAKSVKKKKISKYWIYFNQKSIFFEKADF